MKSLAPYIAHILVLSLFMQGCSSLGDDAFAHAVKRGNHAQTMRLMQPHHGKLEIQEINGRWYNPLQYAIAANDSEACFALLERGAPRSFDGQSLAYNAARVQHYDLARRFSASGYGSDGDIARAQADIESARRSSAQANAAALAVGVLFVAALLSSSPGRSSSNGYQINEGAVAHFQNQNNAARAQGLPPPNRGF